MRVCNILLSASLSGVALLAGTPALACPDIRKNGSTGTYTSDQLYSPVSHRVRAGGDQEISDCSGLEEGANGHVTSQPDFTFRLTGNAENRRKLRFRVDGACDTMLLVNTAAGRWRFDDDGGDGLDPQLDIDNAPDGIYDIWVGTHGSDNCAATLVSETFNYSSGRRNPAVKRSTN